MLINASDPVTEGSFISAPLLVVISTLTTRRIDKSHANCLYYWTVLKWSWPYNIVVLHLKI